MKGNLVEKPHCREECTQGGIGPGKAASRGLVNECLPDRSPTRLEGVCGQITHMEVVTRALDDTLRKLLGEEDTPEQTCGTFCPNNINDFLNSAEGQISNQISNQMSLIDQIRNLLFV